jgi:phosphoenolpyruvate phosphomutase
LLNALIEAGEAIEVQYVHGHWRGVNDLEDFRRAGDFAHAQAPFAAAVGSGAGKADAVSGAAQ